MAGRYDTTGVHDEAEVTPWERVRAGHEAAFGAQLDYLMAHSAFYRRKFGGVDLARVRGLADLARLPFTTKSELRESLAAAPPLGEHVAAAPQEIVQIQSTSGTTGAPTFVAATAADIEAWNLMGARVFYANGFRPRDWVLHCFATGRGFVGGLPILQHLRALGAGVIPFGAESGTERLLHAIAQLRPVAMVGTPSMIAHLGSAAEAVLGRPAHELSVRKISVGGEPGGGAPAVRSRLEELWGADVRDMMGGADFGSTYWAECENKDGMHLCSQGVLHVEIIDPQTCESLPIEPGVHGELVYTALTRRASPLMRYRMGDLVTVGDLTCPCGRTGYRISVHGRADDMLIVRGVNVFPAAIKDIVMALRPRTTGLMKVLIDFPGHSTYAPLRLRVEHEASLTEPGQRLLRAEIQDRIRQALTIKTDVALVPAGTITPPGTAKEQLTERIAEGVA